MLGHPHCSERWPLQVRPLPLPTHPAVHTKYKLVDILKHKDPRCSTVYTKYTRMNFK